MATKCDLIRAVSSNMKYINQVDVALAIEIIIDCLQSELSKGSRIELRGVGSFSIKHRKYANMNALYKKIYYRAAKNIIAQIN